MQQNSKLRQLRFTFEQSSDYFLKAQFNRRQQKIFLEDLHSLISDSVAPSQAIDILCETTGGLRQIVAQEINDALSQGRLLADGMRSWFCSVAVEIIYAGETSGSLTTALESSINSLDTQQSTRRQFVSHLIYPFMLFVLSCSLIIFIEHSLASIFLPNKPFNQWPAATQNIFSLVYLIQDWWWLFIFFAISSVFFALRLLRDLSGDARLLLDSWPLISLYRNSTAAHFMQLLGRMLDNGVATKKALLILQQDASPYLSWHIMNMEFNLSGNNDNIADIINTKLISRDNILRLKVIARTRGIAKALMSLGEQTEARVRQKILLISRLIGGALVIASGALLMMMVSGLGSVLAQLCVKN